MSLRRATIASALGLTLAVSGCTNGFPRTDSVSHVEIDGRMVLVSWVWVGEDLVDLHASSEPPKDEPNFAISAPRLDAPTARRAVENVVAWRCDAVAAGPAVAMPVGGFAFRYSCQR